MSCAVIVHGAIGSGKTSACLELAGRARARGLPVGGILSVRVYRGEELIGYDCLDLTDGGVFPMARLRERVDSSDWFVFDRLIYAFSASGFERANRILTGAAEKVGQPSIVFMDEFGRLERTGRGIYLGAVRVAEALRRGGVAVFTCRTDMIEAVMELVEGKARVTYPYHPRDLEAIWQRVLNCIGASADSGQLRGESRSARLPS